MTEGEDDMEGKKSVKKRVLIIVCSVLLIFVAAAGVLLIRNGLKQETYKEAIQTAEKYVAEQNYEDAIVAYENAISAVPDREEPYMGLADVYLIQDKVSLARSTLEKGYAATNSKSIYSMIQGIDNGSLLINRFDQQQTKETMEKRGELGWNQAFLQRLEDYTYTDYSDEYGGWPDITKVSKGEVKVVYDDFDPEKGLAMAIAKKALGNKYNYFNIIKKWVDKYLEKEDK